MATPEVLAERFLFETKDVLKMDDDEIAFRYLDRCYSRFVRGIVKEEIYVKMPKTVGEKYRAIELVSEMFNEMYDRRLEIAKEKLRFRTISNDIETRKLEGGSYPDRRWEDKWARLDAGKIEKEEDFIRLLTEKLEEVEYTFELELLAYEVRSIVRGNYMISDETRERLREVLREFGEVYNVQPIFRGIRGLNLYGKAE